MSGPMFSSGAALSALRHALTEMRLLRERLACRVGGDSERVRAVNEAIRESETALLWLESVRFGDHVR